MYFESIQKTYVCHGTGHSGQPVQDISMQTVDAVLLPEQGRTENPWLDILIRTLLWGHICPTGEFPECSCGKNLNVAF